MTDTIIGTVSMQENHSLVLSLRAEDDDQTQSDALFVLLPGERGYTETLQRVQGLQPGQSKPLPAQF